MLRKLRNLLFKRRKPKYYVLTIKDDRLRRILTERMEKWTNNQKKEKFQDVKMVQKIIKKM